METKRRNHPFYPGQSHDDVLSVCKRTGRRREKLSIVNADGEVIETGQAIDLTTNLTFVSTYPDMTLTFKRGRLPDGTGALCYRIAKIQEKG